MFEGNRVHPRDIDEAIQHDKTVYVLLPDGRTTICLLTLDNGYTVRGEASCVDIANYNKDTGEQIALQNAKDAVWPLLGFRLADRLAAAVRLREALDSLVIRDCGVLLDDGVAPSQTSAAPPQT